MRLFHFVLLTLLLWTPSAQAKEYAIYGWGFVSCAEWSKERTKSPEGKQGGLSKDANSYVAWVQGFLSGYNLFGPGGGHILQGMDVLHDVGSWLDKYCKDHPDKNIAHAANALVVERLAHEPIVSAGPRDKVQRALVKAWRKLDKLCRSDLGDAAAQTTVCQKRDVLASKLREHGCQYDNGDWNCT